MEEFEWTIRGGTAATESGNSQNEIEWSLPLGLETESGIFSSGFFYTFSRVAVGSQSVFCWTFD